MSFAFRGKTESSPFDVALHISFQKLKSCVMVLSGRNAYATSVLRRVEMKLNGRDNVDNRYLLLTWRC